MNMISFYKLQNLKLRTVMRAFSDLQNHPNPLDNLKNFSFLMKTSNKISKKTVQK